MPKQIDMLDTTRVDLKPRVPVGTALVRYRESYRYACAGEDLKPSVFVETGLSEEDRVTIASSPIIEMSADIIYGKVIAAIGDPRDKPGILGWSPMVEVKKGNYFWIREIPMGATFTKEAVNENRTL